MVTKIFNKNGTLYFDGDSLASVNDYKLADRCVGSVFESLNEGEIVQFLEGVYELDSDLDVSEKIIRKGKVTITNLSEGFCKAVRLPYTFKNSYPNGYSNWKERQCSLEELKEFLQGYDLEKEERILFYKKERPQTNDDSVLKYGLRSHLKRTNSNGIKQEHIDTVLAIYQRVPYLAFENIQGCWWPTNH